jgi:hypothetical protein
MLPETTTIDEVKDWLKAKEKDETVISFLAEMNPDKPVTAEQVNEFLSTEEGKNLIQPIMDKHTTEGIKTYRKNQFDREVKSAVAAEIYKLNPSETPEQKRIRELEEKDRQRDAEWARKDLDSQINTLAFKEGVDSEFLSGIAFNSLPEAQLYIKNFKNKIETAKTEKANELLASGFKPGSGLGEKKEGMTFSQYAKLPESERLAMQESGAADNLTPD